MSEPRTFIFEVYQGGQLVRTERIAQDVIKIGSHAKSHLFIEDPAVSRVHAVIEATGDDVFLIDLGSGRGTLLNGQRINKSKLSHRDKIQLGDTEVVFFTRDEKAEAAAAAAAEAARREAEEALKRAHVPDMTVYSRRFLARPASSDGSVEVAMLYRDYVMADEIYKPPQEVTIGSADDCDFHVEHASVPGEKFTLIGVEGDNPTLFVTPGMTGDLYIGSEKLSLQDAVASGKARRAGNAAAIPLTESTRARIGIGDIVFFVHRSTKPKLILPFQMGQGSVFLYIAISAILHTLFILLVNLLPPPIDDIGMNGMDMNDRFVQLLMQEEEEEEPELPELPEDEDSEDEETAEREAGDEGRAGDEREEETDNRMAVEGDNTEDQPTELALRQATEEALQTGALNVLNQMGPTSLFGSTASGYDDIMAIGSVTGDAPGANYGMSGLGAYGGGLSGGGTRTRGGFGSGPIAVRGRSSGDQVGRELRDVSDRQVRQVSVVPGNPEIRGQLDREIIQRVIREHRREIRACYEGELQANPDLEGRVLVAFVISPDGAVASASVSETTLGSSAVEDCVVRRVRRWRFPEPRGGGIVRVSYPFVFSAGG